MEQNLFYFSIKCWLNHCKTINGKLNATSIEFTQEAEQRSTIELYFVIHQNNKLSISASYCNKLNNQKLTKKKTNRYTSIYTMVSDVRSNHLHLVTGGKCQIRHEAASTWCCANSSRQHMAYVVSRGDGQYKANPMLSTIVCTSKQKPLIPRSAFILMTIQI